MAHSCHLLMVLFLCSAGALETDSTSSCSNLDSSNCTVPRSSEADAAELEALVQMRLIHQSKTKQMQNLSVSAGVTPECCQAGRPYNSKQVHTCGCNSGHFPAGTKFYLEGKWSTVETSWNVACSMKNCQGGCATVNFKPSHWWSEGSPIKFEGDACPAGSKGPLPDQKGL